MVPETIDKLSCVHSTPSRRLQSSSAVSTADQISFYLKAPTGSEQQAANAARILMSQMRQQDSPLLNSSVGFAATYESPESHCPAGSQLTDTKLDCVRCVAGTYNPTRGGNCKPCPKYQTSTEPFHSCHCEPGRFNGTYVEIRCFESDEHYAMSSALTKTKARPDCTLIEDVWRGTECCKPCPIPTDQTAPLPAHYPYDKHMCVDCMTIGSTVNEYGEPVGDHGIMVPRVLEGWDQSASGKLRSVLGFEPLLGAIGPSGVGNGGQGNVVELNQQLSSKCKTWTTAPHGRDPAVCFVVEPEAPNPQPGQLGTVVEINIFRCPFQTHAETGQVGSCMGQVKVHSNNSALEAYRNMTHCLTGYGGALCASCALDYVMTDNGCIKCDAADFAGLLWVVGGLVLSFVFLFVAFSALKRRLQQDADNSESEESEEEETRTLTDLEEHTADVSDQPHAERNLWRKARAVKMAVSFQVSTEMAAAQSRIGLEDMQDAMEDAKTLTANFKSGIKRGQTQIKISIGLTQILGALPAVLNIKYPTLFNGFLESLSFFTLDIFKMIKFDCLATTTLHSKFIITMLVPVAIVGCLQFYKHCKQRHLRAHRHLLGKDKVISLSAQLDSDIAGLCFAAVFYL